MIEYKLDKNGNLFPIKVFSINSKCPKCNHSYRQEEQKGKPFFIEKKVVAKEEIKQESE